VRSKTKLQEKQSNLSLIPHHLSIGLVAKVEVIDINTHRATGGVANILLHGGVSPATEGREVREGSRVVIVSTVVKKECVLVSRYQK